MSETRVPPAAKQPGLLQRAFSFISGRKSGGYPQPTAFSFSSSDVDVIKKLFAGSSWTGRNVNDEFAMQVSTVWRCVMLLSQTVGSLPWAVYERIGPRQSREVEDHPLAEVLVHSPNADMDRMQFRESVMANLALRGNSYALKETRNDGSVSSLYPMPARQTTPERNRQTGEMQYIFEDRGRREIYPREKVWHVRLFSFDGLVGLSPLGYGRQAIALTAAAEEFGARFFGQGGRASAIVRIPQWLDEDERAKAKKNINELYSGLDNAHRVRLLEGGMEYEEISAKPGEAQHNELRGFQIPDICRFYGVPPHLAFDLTHGSYNNVETLATEFVTFGLLPHLIRIETAAQRQLLPPGQRRKYFVRFNFEGLLRANSQERSQFYATMLQNGVLSRNEVREKENLDRTTEPGMDERTVQTNLAFIQFLEAFARAGMQSGRGNNPAPDEGAKGLNVSVAPQISIPESVKYSVDLAGIQAIAASVATLAQAVGASSGQQLEAIKHLGELVQMPSRPVFGPDGRLIGSEKVKKL